MDFEQIPGQANNEWSPDGTYIAGTAGATVLVRLAITHNVSASFQCLDRVDKIEWSPRGPFLLCAQHKRGVVQVFDVRSKDWSFRINAGISGVIDAMFSPDGGHIVTFSDFQLKLTVWDVGSRAAVCHVKNPKQGRKVVSFSGKDSKYMAVLQRQDGRDGVSVIACDDWSCLQQLPIATCDAQQLQWAHDDAAVIVIDSPPEDRICVYSVFGQLLKCIQPHTAGLGVKSAAQFSRTAPLFATGSYDDKLRVYSQVTFDLLVELTHRGGQTDDGDRERGDAIPETLVYKEVLEQADIPHGGSARDEHRVSRYVIDTTVDVSARGAKPSGAVPPPNTSASASLGSVGVSIVEWSPDSRWIASKSDSEPCVVRVWDTNRYALHSLLVQMHNVKCIAWEPSQCAKDEARLWIGASDHLYVWMPQGASAIDLPGGFGAVHRLQWNADASAFLVENRDGCCLVGSPPSANGLLCTDEPPVEHH